MAEPFLPPEAPVDLTNCDREPIHIPGAIQPHGYLFVVQDHRMELLQASENASEILGAPVQEYLGRPLPQLLGLREPEVLGEWLRELQDQSNAPRSVDVTTGDGIRRFHAIAHRDPAGIILELEAIRPERHLGGDVTPFLQAAIDRLQATKSVEELCRVAAVEVRRITGFDRVMIYQFDSDWHGVVLAEDLAEGMDSFLGLHFPASDIPAQARKLYTLNRLRLIANVGYTPSPIVPALSPVTGAPLDLSRAVLRSVSPIHLEYLKNLDVGASMSISLLQEDRLWGLVACHHPEPLFVPYAVRTACHLLSQVFSMLLAVKRELEEKAHNVQLRAVQARLLESMVRAQNFADGLVHDDPNMLDLLRTSGAVIYRDGQITRIGETPPPAAVAGLASWLERNMQDDVFCTDALSSIYPDGESIRSTASGVLAFSLSRLQRYFAIWSRPEAPRTVYWAGNPNKAVYYGDGSLPRLHPRRSFESWKDVLRGRAEPWLPVEVEAARMLRASIIDVVLVKADELARLNASLEEANRALGEVNTRMRQEIAERQEAEARLAATNAELVSRNRELQHFAFVGSHDLQEPLRKINSFADLLRMEYADRLDDQARHYLERMRSAAARMSQLISDLLAYSRIPTSKEEFVPVDLGTCVAEAVGSLKHTLEAAGGRVEVGPLPTVEAEPDQIRRLFENLISNALKYRSEAPPVVRISGEVEEPPSEGAEAPVPFARLRVEDNGIGFDEKYLDRIFSPFQRLHGRNEYGGTGMGLAISQRIVEHHRGTISAQSTPGAGSTFVIALPVSRSRRAERLEAEPEPEVG